MKVYAISDLHVDFPENLDWLAQLSREQYTEDLLILAGDVTDDLELLKRVFGMLLERFQTVCFVPGNHELWVRGAAYDCSIEKFHAVLAACEACGVETGCFRTEHLSVVPLYGWYDFSFGEPDASLKMGWRDFHVCSWPQQLSTASAVNNYFLSLNNSRLSEKNQVVISYSHFVPHIELMPDQIPPHKRVVYPVLGSQELGNQVSRLNPDIHVYGHSHVNQEKRIGSIKYVNNAFGYPSESRISKKKLHCVFDSITPQR